MNKYQEQTENLGAYCDKYAITLCDMEGNDVTTFLPKQTYFITACKFHPHAYSPDDIEGGKISASTLMRAIQANEPLCVCCRKDKGLRTGRHLGAQLYQNLHNKGVEVLNFDQFIRSDITKDDRLEYYCPKCTQLNERSARDLASFRADGCGQSNCSRSEGINLKYCVKDVLNAAMKLNLVVKSIESVKTDLSIADDIAISTSDTVVLTCENKHHQYEHPTNISTLMSGNTGCSACSKALSMNEITALTLIELFYSGDDIKINSFPAFLDRLQMDIHIESLQIGVEVQGTQHYELSPGLHKSTKCLEEIQKRDKKKVMLCHHSLIDLIQLDARETERSKSILAKLTCSAKNLLPQLHTLHPDIFPQTLSEDKLQTAVSTLYEVKSRYINATFLQQKAKFEYFCEKKGLTIHSEFVGQSVEIQVSCVHHAPSWRTPQDIMAAKKSNQCCTGKKASTKRAVECAAKLGLIVDIVESETDPKCTWPPIYVGTSKFWTFCLCGKVNIKTSINALERNNTSHCTCLSSEKCETLATLYDKTTNEYDFDHIWWNKQQTIANDCRQKEADNRVNIDKKIISTSLRYPDKGRLSVYKRLKGQGVNVTEDRLRKVMEEAGLKNEKDRIFQRELLHEINLL